MFSPAYLLTSTEGSMMKMYAAILSWKMFYEQKLLETIIQSSRCRWLGVGSHPGDVGCQNRGDGSQTQRDLAQINWGHLTLTKCTSTVKL